MGDSSEPGHITAEWCQIGALRVEKLHIHYVPRFHIKTPAKFAARLLFVKRFNRHLLDFQTYSKRLKFEVPSLVMLAFRARSRFCLLQYNPEMCTRCDDNLLWPRSATFDFVLLPNVGSVFSL